MRKTYYYNETTHEKTPATANTEKYRYEYQQIAIKWYQDGATVDIIDADTGEICLIWAQD